MYVRYLASFKEWVVCCSVDKNTDFLRVLQHVQEHYFKLVLNLQSQIYKIYLEYFTPI